MLLNVIGAPNKKLVFTVFLVFPVSAARSGMAKRSGYAELECKELPRGFCLLQFGLTRAKSYRRGKRKFVIPAVASKAEGAALLKRMLRVLSVLRIL